MGNKWIYSNGYLTFGRRNKIKYFLKKLIMKDEIKVTEPRYCIFCNDERVA